MKQERPELSERRICRVLEVSRSAVRDNASQKPAQPPAEKLEDTALVDRMRHWVLKFPTFGYRRVWALLRHKDKLTVNKKKVYRLMRKHGWLVHRRSPKARPRVQQSRSRATRSNERWAIDITHLYCGQDGWAHLVAVIDCYDREIVGYELALRGRAKEAERALEEACLKRFGMVFPGDEDRPVLRSDNGLVFLSKTFRAACKQYGLSQEYITPYTPEQNGMIERFFRSLKEECVWLQLFDDFEQARKAVVEWMTWYNTERPHQSLGYLSPAQFRAQPLGQAA